MIIHQPIEDVIVNLTDATNWNWPGQLSLQSAETEAPNVIKATYNPISDDNYVLRWSVSRTNENGSQVVTFTTADLILPQTGEVEIIFRSHHLYYPLTPRDNGTSTAGDPGAPQARIIYTLTPTDNGASTDVIRDPRDDYLLQCLAQKSGDNESTDGDTGGDTGVAGHGGPP
jgi:hypothetical protein